METVQRDNHQVRPLTKHSLHVLSAVPKPRHYDNWMQQKPKNERKNYNQHWVIHVSNDTNYVDVYLQYFLTTGSGTSAVIPAKRAKK